MQYPNLHQARFLSRPNRFVARVELAGYWVPEGIADLARTYGPERILWGSGFPQYNQGSSMLQLKQSGLDEAEIALIAGKNFENMLEAAQC